MERIESIRLLEELLVQIQKYESAVVELNKAEESLKVLRAKTLTAVSDFDMENKMAFIESRAGTAPVKPKGVIKLAVPIYLSKKKVYKKEYLEYQDRFQRAEEQYYTEFKDIRENLESEEKAKIAFAIQLEEDAVSEANENFQIAAASLNENSIVSPKLKNITVVEILIEYFKDQRVDSIKEAVNLYFEEEHRKHLEEFAEKQVRLTAEATEQARLAAISASEAADSAEEAVRRADDAMMKAEDALDRANEAYDEAQNAYWTTTSNN